MPYLCMRKTILSIMMSTRFITTVSVLLFCGGVLAHEADSASWRPEFGAELTSEVQVTYTGRCNLANLLRLHASLPVGRGLSVEIGTISTYMTSESSIGQDLQLFSNLDATRIPIALSVLGLNWQITDEHSLFAGVRNVNEDYFTSPVTSLFTNASSGIFPTISYNYPLANYPLSAVGLHYGYSHGSWNVLASLYNGSAYYEFTGHDNVFRFCPGSDGLFGMAQVEYRHKGSSYFLGACSHYGDFYGFSQSQHGSSLWAYAEQALTPSLSLIAAYSHGFGTETLCDDFAGFGAKYDWGRCEFGIFTDYARFDDFNESATEITCKVRVTRFLSIQPTIHLISSPVWTDDRNTFNGAGTLRIQLRY